MLILLGSFLSRIRSHLSLFWASPESWPVGTFVVWHIACTLSKNRLIAWVCPFSCRDLVSFVAILHTIFVPPLLYPFDKTLPKKGHSLLPPNLVLRNPPAGSHGRKGTWQRASIELLGVAILRRVLGFFSFSISFNAVLLLWHWHFKTLHCKRRSSWAWQAFRGVS